MPGTVKNVQIFGVRSSQATRAAERFFKERRISIQMVDLQQKPMSNGEIQRFIERFRMEGLLDREGKSFQEAGLSYMRLSTVEMLRKIEREPKLLRLPLVRSGNLLAVGPDESGWQAIFESLKT